MNEEHVPPPLPPIPAANPPKTFLLQQVGKPPEGWRLTLQPDHLFLEDVSGNPSYVRSYTIPRAEMMKSVMLMEGMRLLGMSKPVNLNFKLTPDQCSELAGWIGEPVLAAHFLKRRYAWVLPVAAIWMLSALPAPGGVGTQGQSYDLVGFGLGAVLMISWAVAKWRPHPLLFLIDSAWFLLLGIRVTMNVIHGRSKFWLILAAMMFWMVFTGLKYFARFRKTKLSPTSN